jgi:transposase
MAKRHPPKVKFQVVLEVLSGGKTPGQVAKAYGVHPNSVSAWKRVFLIN